MRRILAPSENPCDCGCGQPAGVYAKTDRTNGQVKGQPRRFLPGHSTRSPCRRPPKARGGQLVRAATGAFVPPSPRTPTDRVPAGCPLSNIEYDIVCHVARGRTYKETAQLVGLSISTISSHMSRAFTGLGVASSRGAIAAVIVMKDMGWIGAPPRPAPPADPQLGLQQAAYCAAFTRLIRERTARCEHMVTIAFMLLCLHIDLRPEWKRRSTPDIDELLLRMARGCQRPIP